MRFMDNKQTVQAIMDALARSDRTSLFDAMSDDVRWRWMGVSKWSKTFEGKTEVIGDLFGGVEETLSDFGVEVHNIIAEGDHVAVEHSGRNETPDGRSYNNNYCWVLSFRDGRIAEVREYMDTQLVTDTFSEDAS
jgi:uncharacterized protein